MRLTLVIYSLDAGGAERVLSFMANAWASMGREVTVLLMVSSSEPPFYELDQRVRLPFLGIANVSTRLLEGFRNNRRRIRVLRDAICDSRPHVVIGFMDTTNVLTLIATRGLNVPVLVVEHTDPAMYRLGSVWKQLRLWTYRWADRVVVLNERTRRCFPNKIRKRTVVIPNPVFVEHHDTSAWSRPVGKSLLVAMGRLVEEKGFDLLLRAFSRLNSKYTDWDLVILGEGPLRRDLESLRDALGLSGRVHLPGKFRNPHAILRQGDLFVLSSRQEAFPLALCEAMACGLPVISTEYHEGVHEIVREGIDGVIVPAGNADALAAAMDRLMADREERKRLASRAVEVSQRFSPEKCMAMWETLLKETAGKISS